jgi:hypothetical protein
MAVRWCLLVVFFWARAAGATDIAVKGERFLLDGRPTFMLGCSYYGALGASEQTIRADLDEMRRCGFNWVRVWVTWAAYDNDISAVDRATGEARPQHMDRLRFLLRECDRRQMIVNVTISRGNGVTGKERLQSVEAHRKAVETLASALKDHPNWYLDLSNERNIRDKRYTSMEDLAELLKRAKGIDGKRLVTASHAGDVSRDELAKYVNAVGVDFLSIHRPRQAGSPQQTEAKTREYLEWVRAAGRIVPLHYDEPFRRGFARWDPTAEDFWTDLMAAEKAGAAGWCFHNGDQRAADDKRPRRSFDLRGGTLFGQLDGEERKFMDMLRRRGG